jgi:hypothetical protein
MRMDRHTAVGILGSIVTATSFAVAVDVYTKICGAIAATLTVVYMLGKNRSKK